MPDMKMDARPMKSLDFYHELIRESKSLTVNENGRRKRISKHEVVIKQLIKLAMTGSIPAARTYLDRYQQVLEGRSGGTSSSSVKGRVTGGAPGRLSQRCCLSDHGLGAATGLGIRKVHEPPNATVRPSGREIALYSSRYLKKKLRFFAGRIKLL
jgi:hypothetical protein